MDYKASGLKITYGFITPEEEAEIISKLVKTSPKSVKGRNSIQRFGSDLPYKGSMISKEIPPYFEVLCQRLFDQGLVDVKPDSISVNEYRKGQGINPHIDSMTSGEVITVLSLMSDAVMVFTKQKESFKVDLPPRCISQLSKDIRYNWMHSIEPVLADRYSIVFRKGRTK